MWETLLKPLLSYIRSEGAQVLVYTWLFLELSPKMLAENPNSVAPQDCAESLRL